jgi:hypothetical protein
MMIFAGCATKHVNISDHHAATKLREVLVQQVEYTPKGLPSFLNQLGYRPSNAGDHFTVAQLINDHPATSFDIAVVGPNADFNKPFKVVYEWTGKGYRGGALGSAVTTQVARFGNVNSTDDALLMVAVILTPVVVGTVGGFIIGVADGIKTTAEEVGKVVLGNYEQVVTYTTYAYDGRDRLFLMRMFKADDDQQELVRTEYTYEADDAKPTKTVITTFPDGTVKTL